LTALVSTYSRAKTTEKAVGLFQYIPCTLAPNALKLIKYGLCSGQRLECVGGQAAVIQGLGTQGPGLECGGVGGGHYTDKKEEKISSFTV
jgi:hypothetical protein